MNEDVLDQGMAGFCPRCGVVLRDPSEDYVYDNTGVPHTIRGLELHWCAACGWEAS